MPNERGIWNTIKAWERGAWNAHRHSRSLTDEDAIAAEAQGSERLPIEVLCRRYIRAERPKGAKRGYVLYKCQDITDFVISRFR